MGKILVIGGSGFLGKHLLDALLASGACVRSLDITDPDITHERLEVVKGSFTDAEIVAEAMHDCQSVFHLVSTTLPKSSNDNPIFDIETNLVSTVALLDAAVKYKIKKFIFISSGGTVYGIPSQVPVSEQHSTNPLCSYGIVKLAIEKYLQMYHDLYGLETCSLRLSNPFGENQRVDRGQGAVTVFCHQALAGETIEIWGDGSVVRDFIYVKDAVRAMQMALVADCAGSVINIGYGQGLSLNQLILLIEAACGFKIKTQYLAARSFDVPEMYLDISLAKQMLGWQPEVSLVDGINQLIKALRQQGM